MAIYWAQDEKTKTHANASLFLPNPERHAMIETSTPTYTDFSNASNSSFDMG